MRGIRDSLLSITLALFACATGCGAAREPDTDANNESKADMFAEDQYAQVAALAYAPNELIIRTLPGATDDDIASALASADVAVIDALPEIETVVVSVDPNRMLAAAEALTQDANLEAIQKNYYFPAQITPDDPRFTDQPQLTLVGLPDAWEITTGADDIIAAVLDSGVDAEHPDLVGRVLTGRNTFVGSSDTSDAYGHGTLVAGVVAALADNGSGVTGVNWASAILPVRVTDETGRASSRAIASGLVWATNRGAQVMNISFAPLQADSTVQRAARYAFNNGALVFVSSGNDGRRNAARGSREIVFVGASDTADRLATFSSTGPAVDIAAPGVDIWSTANDGDYKSVSGTSFASPLAAGVASLIWSAQPGFRPTTVLSILEQSAVDLGDPGDDDRYGAGRINAAAALEIARNYIESDDRTPPLVDVSAPMDGDVATDIVRVSASAVDLNNGFGVADVTLYLDGNAVAVDTSSPYRFALRTTRLAPGEHTVACVATDAAGNASVAKEVRIQVLGDGSDTDGGSGPDTLAPTATINFPVSGANVSGQVGAQATVTDNVALQSVEWLIDGVVRRATTVLGTREQVSFTWNADGASSGNHLITVRVTDAAGNESSTSVAVTKQ